MPAARMWWLFGIQSTPPDTAVVPPTVAALSTSTTLAPASWAAMAAVSPAPPVPITTTSASTPHLCPFLNHIAPVETCFTRGGKRVVALDSPTRTHFTPRLG